MANRLTTLALLVALAAFPAASRAGDDPGLEQLVVEMADTPAEHAALAAHFRGKAEHARAEQRRHEGMARSYGGGKLGTRVQLKTHCEKLAADYGAAAAEYDALAKLHDAEAGTH